MRFTLYFSSFHPFILWSLQAPVKSYQSNNSFLQRDGRSKAQQRLHTSLKLITEQNFIVQHIFKSKYLIKLAWLSCQRQLHIVLQQRTLCFSLALICTSMMLGAGVHLEDLPVRRVIYTLIVKFVVVLGHGAIWCWMGWYQQREVLTGADGPVFSASVEFLSSV